MRVPPATRAEVAHAVAALHMAAQSCQGAGLSETAGELRGVALRLGAYTAPGGLFDALDAAALRPVPEPDLSPAERAEQARLGATRASWLDP